tara:strand:+ start:2965 stop:4650 length:1686 start_codon:yes stop_codon:yes gene_type:complete
MELLEQHFDTAFSAPEGIQKLRELILTLAMQGKLVPQNPNDPPASELIRDIEAEKKRLMKEGKIKTPKPFPPIKEKERPYALPEGWAWVRFGDVAQHNAGKTLDKGRNAGEPRRYITTSNLYWGRFELGSVRQMLIKDDELDKCTAKKNDLLICEGGEAGRAAVWPFDSDVCFQNHIHRARFYRDIDPHFAYRFFEKLNATGEINEHRKGVGISNMSGKALASILFPLAPLPEQHRIVAKIDELMARCDALEKLRVDREEKRLAVHAAALSQLLDATGNGNTSGAWAFITQHFGDLYAVKENVVELRKAILQLAVMGKLVRQDPNDPPASELLKEIEAAKRQLVKTGKIKAPKALQEIQMDEVPYGLPAGWEWVRFGNIAFQITDGAHHTPTYISEGVPFLSVKDMSSGYLNFSETRFISKAQHQDLIKRCYPQQGDLLLTKVGTTGIPVLVETNQEFSIFVSVALVKFPQSKVSGKYLSWLVKSPLVKKQSEDGTEGVGNKNLVLRKISNFYLPLPSLDEQHRIVAKIDKLMGLCDTLDQQIEAASSKQTALLNTVMAQV